MFLLGHALKQGFFAWMHVGRIGGDRWADLRTFNQCDGFSDTGLLTNTVVTHGLSATIESSGVYMIIQKPGGILAYRYIQT